MKKIFVSLSLLMTVASSISFANINNLPDPGVEEVFKQEFAGAENVSWSPQEIIRKPLSYWRVTGSLLILMNTMNWPDASGIFFMTSCHCCHESC
jgi:hypothetical protein